MTQINKFQLLLWITIFPINLGISLVSYILNPLVALVTPVYRSRKDYVKLKSKTITMPREYLPKYVYWFQTHDNAVDEYWYGGYFLDSWFTSIRLLTQFDYDTKGYIRYLMRLMWMMRNNAYGFSYNLFGIALNAADPESIIEIPKDGNEKYDVGYSMLVQRKRSWQYKKSLPIFNTGYYTSINIGWKTHDNKPKAMYAMRVVGGIRKYQIKKDVK